MEGIHMCRVNAGQGDIAPHHGIRLPIWQWCQLGLNGHYAWFQVWGASETDCKRRIGELQSLLSADMQEVPSQIHRIQDPGPHVITSHGVASDVAVQIYLQRKPREALHRHFYFRKEAYNNSYWRSMDGEVRPLGMNQHQAKSVTPSYVFIDTSYRNLRKYR